VGCGGEAGHAERMRTAAGKKMRGRLRTSADLGFKTKNGPEQGRRKGIKGQRVFYLLKSNKQMNSNTSKQCISMYASLNSYD
jgi:hypothetical protein